MVEMLRSYNASASLMSDAALADVLRGHVLDSLTLLPLIRRASLHEGRLVDVGTGGGFPGLVLAIAEPALRVTLMDATRKKTAYLERACEELGLEVDVLHARAEDAAHDPALRESFGRRGLPCARPVAGRARTHAAVLQGRRCTVRPAGG